MELVISIQESHAVTHEITVAWEGVYDVPGVDDGEMVRITDLAGFIPCYGAFYVFTFGAEVRGGKCPFKGLKAVFDCCFCRVGISVRCQAEILIRDGGLTQSSNLRLPSG